MVGATARRYRVDRDLGGASSERLRSASPSPSGARKTRKSRPSLWLLSRETDFLTSFFGRPRARLEPGLRVARISPVVRDRAHVSVTQVSDTRGRAARRRTYW